ncbi:Hvo_1808 family surface protein [Halomarina ordinaria]|uniref:Hvo_1808 family surface protein n=1 Tax=Halomarina ordinaria TaxID=3033939 RepID=A0ABD5U908_9EURY|nr:Hvo_1808 family surface protein [Halomarina sp. PSRA2]
MQRSLNVSLPVLLALLALLGAVTPVVGANAQAGPREDPDGDPLGWEDGYWYDDPVDVTPGDGLDEDELDAVVARSMARVEEIRGLEFERSVPVEVVSRAEFREEVDAVEVADERDRLHQNVKFEALFMVEESADAVAVQRANRGATVGGYYDPRSERVVVVSENETAPRVNEVTLAQELFHALQDQHFDVEWENQTTREAHNALDGLIEGDGNYVDYLYEERCGSEWDCLADSAPGAQPGANDLHYGLYFLVYQPYSDGPPFVRSVREEGGWEAVNALYDDPPASTEQVIHPEKYGEDAPTAVEVEDRSDDRWRPLDLAGETDHAAFGEAGIYSMLWYPSYEATTASGVPETVAIPYAHPFNTDTNGRLDGFDPLNYSHPASAGWDGDSLQPYVTDDSRATNETGYVWETAWDSPGDAEEFAAAYRSVLDYHDAERVGERTYRLPDGSGYGDAVHLAVDGDRVTIVNAPTADDLSGVHAVDVARVEEEREGEGEGSEATGPGFGVGVALSALLVALAALVARRGRP